MALLEINDLNTWFFTERGIAKAVQGVSLSVDRGEILGLVGESGSGKSVTNFSIINLLQYPGKIVSGEVWFDGVDLAQLSQEEIRRYRGKKIAFIFQDPLMTLNPVYRIKDQMAEALEAHGITDKKEQYRISLLNLKKVGIPAPEERLEAFPHELSGGMRQRIVIAIGLLNNPDLLLADEPTTALDVTIQSQILYETKNLVKENNMALIWVSHDLATVASLADRIAVMYAGRIVETGTAAEVINGSLHPYTMGLLASAPSRNARGQKLYQIEGQAPSFFDIPQGCAFYARCPYAQESCQHEDAFATISVSETHQVACHRYKEIDHD